MTVNTVWCHRIFLCWSTSSFTHQSFGTTRANVSAVKKADFLVLIMKIGLALCTPLKEPQWGTEVHKPHQGIQQCEKQTKESLPSWSSHPSRKRQTKTNIVRQNVSILDSDYVLKRKNTMTTNENRGEYELSGGFEHFSSGDREGLILSKELKQVKEQVNRDSCGENIPVPGNS